MKIITGDLIKMALNKEFDVIVHQCNCFHNFGAGIALFHEAARHSFASQLARSGATPQQIMYLCRHRDIRTTMLYVHQANDPYMRELVNNRGDVVSLESVRESRKTNEIK